MANEKIILLGDQAEEFNPKNFTYFVKPSYYDMSNIKLEGLMKLAEIVQWGRRNVSKFIERFFGIALLDYQTYCIESSFSVPNVLWCMSRSAGKALDLNTRIPTPNGDRTMKDIHVGDMVYDENGNHTIVTYVSPIYENHQCFEISFNDGDIIIADADHNWFVKNNDNNVSVVKTTSEIYEDYTIYKYSVMCGGTDSKYKTIVNIRNVKSRPVKCIQVSGENHLYLCGNRNTVTHNTTLGSPFLMAKTLLIPNFEGYILSGTGQQSIGMMQKIEKIAKREISSFTGLTDIFLAEVQKSQANTSGFVHAPNSWSYKLFSGSSLATVNSNYDGSRGKRSRLNFYDEASYVSEEMFTATLPFLAQNSDFKLGGDIDVSLLPPDYPNQVVYASSAGSMDDVFYKRYKEFSMHMMGGDKNYFAIDIDCDIIFNATYRGKIYPVPLITPAKVESEMKINPIKATREYKNKFDADGGEDIIVKKAQIIRNSVTRPPELYNSGNALYMLCWDPAAKKDNSTVGIGKLIHHDKFGWRMEIVNSVNLLDKKTKKPLTTPEQIQRVRELMIAYNGYGNPDYQNVHKFMIDAGSGGGATQILNFLFDDFYEDKHENEPDYFHRGMIDTEYEYCQPLIKRYPNAVDIIKMLEPTKYKVEMYTAMIEMIDQDLISFPSEYDYHGYLTILNPNGDEEEENIYKLTPEEEEALKQIDAMKEEVTHMYKYKSSNGKLRYDLAPGFENMIGDDRAYTLAMLGWGLSQLRSIDQIRQKKPKKDVDFTKAFIARAPKKVTLYN